MADTNDRKASFTGASELLNITSPANWVALMGLLMLVVAALVWAFVGNLPVEVSGRAVLIPQGGLTRAQTPASGVITDFHVKVGDRVKKGQLLATLASARELSGGNRVIEHPLPVNSPFDGVVVQNLIDPGNYVDAGQALFLIGDGDSDRLSAWVFVPYENSVAIEIGMPAFLTPESISSEENGYLEGTVTEVGQFPITEDRLADVFGNDPRWINYLLGADEPRALVKVDLTPANTPSGYRWTMGDGPERPLANGMVCDASVRISFSHPVDAALPKHQDKVPKAAQP